MTGGRGVDLVINSLGATTLDRSFDAVRRLGKVISIGEAEGDPFKNIRERLLPKSLTFTRFHLGHVDRGSPLWHSGVEAMLGGIVEGWLEVPIERVYPLDRARDMHAALEFAPGFGQAPSRGGRAALGAPDGKAGPPLRPLVLLWYPSC